MVIQADNEDEEDMDVDNEAEEIPDFQPQRHMVVKDALHDITKKFICKLFQSIQSPLLNLPNPLQLLFSKLIPMNSGS